MRNKRTVLLVAQVTVIMLAILMTTSCISIMMRLFSNPSVHVTDETKNLPSEKYTVINCERVPLLNTYESAVFIYSIDEHKVQSSVDSFIIMPGKHKVTGKLVYIWSSDAMRAVTGSGGDTVRVHSKIFEIATIDF